MLTVILIILLFVVSGVTLIAVLALRDRNARVELKKLEADHIELQDLYGTALSEKHGLIELNKALMGERDNAYRSLQLLLGHIPEDNEKGVGRHSRKDNVVQIDSSKEKQEVT